MSDREIGKIWNDWITVRAYDRDDLPCVGIYYADTARQGCEYLIPPDMARELADLLVKAADAAEGSQ